MIRSFSYSRETKRMETPGIAELPRHIADRGRMLWVDLEDPTDEETGILGGIFGFHVLSVEDCMRHVQLPKLNQYDTYAFLIVHGLDSDRGAVPTPLRTQQVALFVGENYVVTYHRRHVNGIFDTRGQVAKNPGSLLRTPDWLLHGILEALIQDYEPALQHLLEELEPLELDLLSRDVRDQSRRVAQAMTQINHLCRISELHRTALHQLDTSDRRLIADENRAYFRDLYDRTTGILQRSDQFRECLSAAVESHRLLLADRTRGATTVLATTSVVGLPLLLLAIYYSTVRTPAGLHWQNTDLWLLGLVILLVAGVLMAFKKQKWL